MSALKAKAPKFEPPADFADPRKRRDFDPRHWPTCNGQPAAEWAGADLHQRRCIEFLAAYYRLNCLNNRLLAARKKKVSKGKIQTLLAEINAATTALEKLEDRYAPVGFYGEPSLEGVFYRDIAFVRPELPRILPKHSPQSSHVAIPGLEEIPAEELRGPVRVIRFGHGKVDL
jgi:hypothetical protein